MTKTELLILLKKLIHRVFFSLGVMFLLIIILSFTTLPFWMYFNLGQTISTYCTQPDYIVVLGGGGMPSESGLMRTYRASQIGQNYPTAKYIIALPGDTCDRESSVSLMRIELMNRGIDSTTIFIENEGLNTRMQAVNIMNMIGANAKILLVTSPDHMYRASKVFIKAGLKYTCGNPAFEKALESELSIEKDSLDDDFDMLNVGASLQLRYQFWNHFKYQIVVYREYTAIMYYKINGWI